MKELLTKKYGDLPVWAWLLIGAAGIGVGLYFIHAQQAKNAATPQALTTTTTPDLTTGNQSGNETNSETGTVGDNGVINNPFPETTVNGQQVPIIPPGYQAVYDGNGNIIGYEPITITPPTTGSGSGSGSGGTGTGGTGTGGTGTGGTGTPPPVSTPIPAPTPMRYVHPSPWPAPTSTLSGIASANGDTLNQVESLNGWIYQQRHTWNLIYPSDNIRVQ